MQPVKPYTSKRKDIPPGHHPNEVYVLRDWKEYIGESLLIVFSVLLALVVTEVISKVHERDQTREVLHNIRLELIRNKEHAFQQYKYQTRVLKNIDSALRNKAFQQQVINSGYFHLNYIAPDGILYRDLDDVAWQVAKSQNIASRIDIETIAMLTDIYTHQGRIMKVEDEVAKVLLSPESRDPKNANTTLILIHDNYHGWAYDRTPVLLKNYEKAIKLLASKE